MEKLKKLIENLKIDKDKVLCFYGFNDGRKRACQTLIDDETIFYNEMDKFLKTLDV